MHIVFLNYSRIEATNLNIEHTSFKEKEKQQRLRALKVMTSEDEKRLKTLQIEYDVWLSLGKQLPEHMTDEMWSQLMFECPTVSSRARLYLYWYKREKAKQSEQLRKAIRAKHHEEHINEVRRREAEEGTHMKNTFFLHLRSQSIVQHYYGNLCHAMLFGLPIVFDMSFESVMRRQEIINLADQLQLCHGINKVASQPFHFHFCNVDASSILWQQVKYAIPNVESVPLTVSHNHYLDLFCKSRLVYLTPDAPTTLDCFNPDDVYIIGGIVDKSSTGPITYPKSKKEGIRSAKFPLDRYLR